MENIFKSWFTTIVGAVIMALAVYEWKWEGEDIYQCVWPFLGGFALMFMKDMISQWINDLVKAVISKFSSKP